MLPESGDGVLDVLLVACAGGGGPPSMDGDTSVGSDLIRGVFGGCAVGWRAGGSVEQGCGWRRSESALVPLLPLDCVGRSSASRELGSARQVASRLHTCPSHCQLAGGAKWEARFRPWEAAICQELLHSYPLRGQSVLSVSHFGGN